MSSSGANPPGAPPSRRGMRLALAPAALVLVVVAGCGGGDEDGGGAEQRARDLVAQMTVAQKISQVHGAASAEDFRIVPGIAELGIPPLTVTNGPAGVGPGPQVLNNVPATALPSPLLLASTWDVEMARAYGDVQGAEMRAIGRNLLEAPDVDLARIPRNGRTFEAYGEDPHLVSRLAVANIRAIQDHGVLAMVKHYVVNNQERDRATVDVQVDERTLRELYLPPFEAAVREGEVASLMCSYNRVKGPYSCENEVTLMRILKEEWGFAGFVQSDFGATHSTLGSANAGMDLEMPNPGFFAEPLSEAVLAGEVAVERLDDMLIRRFAQMIRLGVFDREETTTPIPVAEHAALARAIGAAGTVLLRNENDLLPLHAGRLTSVAVVGPWSTRAATGGGGSSMVNPIRAVPTLDGIRSRLGDGVELRSNDGTDAATAAAVAAGADVAIVVAGDFETEGIDRATLSLPEGQDELIAAVAAANARTVVVLHAGAPVLMPWRADVAAIVAGWYPGGEDGEITAAVLFGEANPSGKLPITFPRSEDDGPANTPERYPGVDGKVYYDEGLLVGYRWYEATGREPLYPFGFGLSYTTFSLADLRVDTHREELGRAATVRVTVTNTGDRVGSEVVQAYVAYPDGLGAPAKQLRAFAKVAVAAGESRRVTLALEPRAFAYWDVAVHDWSIAPGDYRVLVGTSSADTPLTATVRQ